VERPSCSHGRSTPVQRWCRGGHAGPPLHQLNAALLATVPTTLKIDSFFLAGPGNRGGLSPVFRPRLRRAEKTGTVTVYSSPEARIPRVPPRRAKRTGPSHEIPAAPSPLGGISCLEPATQLGEPTFIAFQRVGSFMRGKSAVTPLPRRLSTNLPETG